MIAFWASSRACWLPAIEMTTADPSDYEGVRSAKSLNKPDLKEYAILKTSAMPSYRDKLNPQELADLVAYLTTLNGAL